MNRSDPNLSPQLDVKLGGIYGRFILSSPLLLNHTAITYSELKQGCCWGEGIYLKAEKKNKFYNICLVCSQLLPLLTIASTGGESWFSSIYLYIGRPCLRTMVRTGNSQLNDSHWIKHHVIPNYSLYCHFSTDWQKLAVKCPNCG